MKKKKKKKKKEKKMKTLGIEEHACMSSSGGLVSIF
jgi:hypothetical protein